MSSVNVFCSKVHLWSEVFFITFTFIVVVLCIQRLPYKISETLSSETALGGRQTFSELQNAQSKATAKSFHQTLAKGLSWHPDWDPTGFGLLVASLVTSEGGWWGCLCFSPITVTEDTGKIFWFFFAWTLCVLYSSAGWYEVYGIG